MLQIGQLYVWGLMCWLTPSSSTFQSMESSSWLHWMYSQPMYIANTGGATGGLPITRPPSFGIPDSERRRWVPLLRKPFKGQCMCMLHRMSADVVMNVTCKGLLWFFHDSNPRLLGTEAPIMTPTGIDFHFYICKNRSLRCFRTGAFYLCDLMTLLA